MDLATFDDERAVPCSCDPRIAAVRRHARHRPAGPCCDRGASEAARSWKVHEVTGVCCRCQIRHEENGWLCCRHGVICSDDVGAGELTLVALSTFVFAAVLAAATWVGMHGTDVEKLAAGLMLVAAGAPTLVWALRSQVER